MGFFGNLMNNYMYGKSGKADYTERDMPNSRARLFREVLRVRWSALFGLNLLYMLIWLPALIWSLINVMTLLAALDTLTAELLRGMLLTYLLILAPCIAITGPFTAGITRVCRNWARDEHSFVVSDFFEAVRDNWKQALPVSLISGLAPLVMYIGAIVYGSMAASSPIFYLPTALVLLLGIMWKLAEPIMYVMMITYRLKLKDIIKNALIMVIARLPHTVGIKLITLLVPVIGFLITYIFPAYTMTVISVVTSLYLVWLTAFHRLLYCSLGNYVCEKYLNPLIKGAATDIGLRPKDTKEASE